MGVASSEKPLSPDPPQMPQVSLDQPGLSVSARFSQGPRVLWVLGEGRALVSTLAKAVCPGEGVAGAGAPGLWVLLLPCPALRAFPHTSSGPASSLPSLSLATADA